MRYLSIYLLGMFSLFLFSSCSKEASTEYLSPAKGSLKTSSGDCLPKSIGGTYAAGKAINDSNYIEVTIELTAPGPYAVSTDTVNGYFFKGSGHFPTKGAKVVRLKGFGKPLVNGLDNFTIAFDGTTCDVSIACGGVGGGGGGTITCGTAAGTYTPGTAVTAANKIVLSHTYATVGNFTVSSNTVNGFSFGPATVAATAGTATSITLTATGTPAVAGTNTFVVNYGDGSSCTFTVSVGGVVVPPGTNTDYFPMTLNSWWSYDDGAGSDSIKYTNVGAVTLGSTSYQRFVISDDAGPYDTAHYRKDAATNVYYQVFNSSDFEPFVQIAQPRIEVMFLKNSLSTNDTWNSDHAATANGMPVTLRAKVTCLNANASATINGKNFSNVYHMKVVIQIGALGIFSDLESQEYYFAKGIGRIQTLGLFDDELIRNWKVN